MLETPVFSTFIASGCGCINFVCLDLPPVFLIKTFSSALGFCSIFEEVIGSLALFSYYCSSESESESEIVCASTTGFSASG
jgi:hypothetical protein